MKQFQYVAIDKSGSIQRGSMSANTSDDVLKALQKTDLNVVSVNEKVSLFDIKSLNEINIGGIPLKEKVVFMRQLATMLSAGISLTSSLDVLVQQIDNKGFKRYITDVTKKVSEGVPFSKALSMESNMFDDITISLIKAGEESGKMDEIFLKIADELEEKNEFQRKITSALIYPVVMLVAIVIVVVLLMVFMVPTMKDMYAEFGSEELPFATRVVVSISNFVMNNKFILIALFVGTLGGIKYSYGTLPGKKFWDNLVLKIPIIGKLVLGMEIASFTRTMALLIQSGIDIVDVLYLTSNVVNNYWIKTDVEKTMEEVQKGVPMALPLSRSTYFPPLISRMVAVGEETGKLDIVFIKMNEYYYMEVKHMSENMSTLLEPIMLIIMGIAVAFIAFAVYGPMFSMSKIIGG